MFQELLKRCFGKVEKMSRNVEVKPLAPKYSSLKAVRIGDSNDQKTLRRQQCGCLSYGLERVPHMLERVPKGNDIERSTRLYIR